MTDKKSEVETDKTMVEEFPNKMLKRARFKPVDFWVWH